MKFMVFFFLAGCATGSVPANFAKVEDGVYRGGQPDADQMKYLKSIGVKSIIDVNDNDDVQAELESAYQLDIKVFWHPLDSFWSPEKGTMLDIEDEIRDSANWPVYIHCEHGQDRTGLVVGEHRLFEGWTRADAYKEMEEHGFHPELLGLYIYFLHHP